MSMSMSDLLTTTEAARELGVRPGTIRNAVATGRIAVVRKGDRNYVSREELDKYKRLYWGKRGRASGKDQVSGLQ